MEPPVRTARIRVVPRVITHSHPKPPKNVCSHHTETVITGNNVAEPAISRNRMGYSHRLRISCEVSVIKADNRSKNA